MAWFKLYEGTATDPKLAVIARRSGQTVAVVLAIWCLLLEQASAAEERGDIAKFDCEAADVVLGLPDGVACTVLEAMRAKGLVTEDGWITNWQKRQGAGRRMSTNTEGSTKSSTQRVREFRARQRAQQETDETTCNTSETDETLHETHETPMKRDETTCSADETHETLHETHETLHETTCNASETGETHIDREIDREKERKREREKKRAHTSETPKEAFGEFGNVKLTAEEHTKLTEEYGDEDTQAAIQFLDLHIGSRKGGDPYKSHYLAMKKWVYNAVFEQQRKLGSPTRASPGQPVKSWQDRESEANIAAFLASN